MGLLTVLSFSAFAAGFGPMPEEFPGDDELPTLDTGDTGDTAATGGCSSQYLRNGVQLPDLPLFYHRAFPAGAWGTQTMVDVLVETARHMRWLMPEASPLLIGDLSDPNGGYMEGHKSHRGGLDADVGIYKTGGWQSPTGFTTLNASTFDLEANWALISTFLDTGKIDMILLDQGHINRLKAYTLRTGLLDEEEIARIFPDPGSRESWASTGIVRHVSGHADHLHVRVLCDDGTRGSR